MKRILVAEIHHESNTLNPALTTGADFSLTFGEQRLRHVLEDNPFDGMVSKLKTCGYDVIPVLSADAIQGVVVEDGFYLEIKRYFLQRLAQMHQIDAIGLALHGSMCTVHIGDVEGDASV